jgi:tripartite-type tricarboxylate transporter receptor subunit TctC
VVENIGGAGASLGAAAVARGQPDGYTILLGGTLPHVNEVLLKSRPLYDRVKDLDPIASVATNFLCIAVHPAVPAQTLKSSLSMRKPIPASCPMGTLVSVRSSI